MAVEGGADRVYVNTYEDGIDPMYLLWLPKTEEGEFEYLRTLQHGVLTIILVEKTVVRELPTPVELST